MKKILHKVFPVLIIVIFFFYWVINIELVLFEKTAKRMLARTFISFNKLAGFKWGVFTSPNTYNRRMYFVLRDTKTKNIIDSIELLENIAIQKKQNAPFNQQDNIIDHLVNNTVVAIEGITFQYQQQLQKTTPGKPSSFYQTKALELTYSNSYYLSLIGTLHNYCKTILSKENININGKEFKLIIAHRSICPFAERNSLTFVPKETIYFETTYNPF